MKQESYDKYQKIISRKIELMKEGKKIIEIKPILANEFFLSDSMINEVLYAKRKRKQMEDFIKNRKIS